MRRAGHPELPTRPEPERRRLQPAGLEPLRHHELDHLRLDAFRTGTGSSGTSAPVTVPSNGPAALSPITFPVDNNTFSLAHLSVTVNINALSSDADLTGFLVAPNGTMVKLFAGLTGQNLTSTVFDDLGNASITTGTAAPTPGGVPADRNPAR